MLKKYFILSYMLTVLLSLSAQRQIIVRNPLSFLRVNEVVEVQISSLNITWKDKKFQLKDATGKNIGYQLMYYGTDLPKSILFEATVLPKSASTYFLDEGEPVVLESKTFARQVPERKDDIAWENDICAYRMYGPALANENPSNGVDVWLKSTGKLIVDQRYFNELANQISYHVDHGDGLDCYKVGQTLGAGGIAPLYNDRLLVGKQYSSVQQIETGPLRSTFMLQYDSVKIGNNYYKQKLTITTNAGEILNKAVVRYEGYKQSFQLAAGIFTHNVKGVEFRESKYNFITYAENAVSDAGVACGKNYVAVYFPSSKANFSTKQLHLLIQSDYSVGKDFVYFFGAGWSKWKFTSQSQWNESVKQFIICQKNPLKISIKKTYVKSK